MSNIGYIIPATVVLIALTVASAWHWVSVASKSPTVKSFAYKNTEQGELHINVYFPGVKTGSNQRAFILFFFGGGWVEGSVDQFRWQADYLSRRGIVAATADYRVSSRHGTTPDNAVEDGQDAIDWVYANASMLGVDPDKVVAAGGSAGGHIAACTSLCRSSPVTRPAALVLLNPVLDLTNASAELEFSSGELELIARLGPEGSVALSPNKNITPQTPPTLLLVGGSDPLILQANDYRNGAIAAGALITMKIAPDQGHGFFNKEPWRSVVAREIEDFLVERGLITDTRFEGKARTSAEVVLEAYPISDTPEHQRRARTPKL